MAFPDSPDVLQGLAGKDFVGARFGHFNIRYLQGNAHLAPSDMALVNSVAGPFWLSLPRNPVFGQVIVVRDVQGECAINPVTIERNGNTIDFAAANYLIEDNFAEVWFFWVGTTWEVGASGGVSAAAVDAAGAVMESDFSVTHCILRTTGTIASPFPAFITENAIVGRSGSAAIGGLSASQVRDIINVEDGADVTGAANVDAAGAVMESDFIGGNFLLMTQGTAGAPQPVGVGPSSFVGRKASGFAGTMSAAEARVVLNVENGADVTDAANVNAAGAVMETDYSSANAILASNSGFDPTAKIINSGNLIGNVGDGVGPINAVGVRTMINVEDGATNFGESDVAGTVRAYTKQQHFQLYSVVISGSYTPNLDNEQVALYTPDGNTTLENPTNPKAGATYVFLIDNGAFGPYTVSWGTAYKWPGGVAPSLGAGFYVLNFVSDGTLMYGLTDKPYS